MKKYLSLIATAIILLSSTQSRSDENIPLKCQKDLLKMATAILNIEGVTKINTCAGNGSSDNCQLDLYPCHELNSQGNKVCYLRFTYGGAYPNYEDYSITINPACEMISIDINRS